MNSDKINAETYWNEKHQNQTFPKEPSPFLQRMWPRLQKGKTLDIGMGLGENAIFLSKQSFQVRGIDISEYAINTAQRFAKEANVALETKKVDLDLYIFGLMEYDTIIINYFKPSVSRIYNEIIRSLKQGGTLLIESYGAEEVREILSPDVAYKDFYYKSNEIIRNLPGMRILFYNENIENGKHVVQCIAQKPLDKDAAKYNLFGMNSQQKDTGPSAQMKLAESLFKKKD